MRNKANWGGRKQAVHRYKQSQFGGQASAGPLPAWSPGVMVRNKANFGRPPAASRGATVRNKANCRRFQVRSLTLEVARKRPCHLGPRTSHFAKKRLAASLRTGLCRAKQSQLANWVGAKSRLTGCPAKAWAGEGWLCIVRWCMRSSMGASVRDSRARMALRLMGKMPMLRRIGLSRPL